MKSSKSEAFSYTAEIKKNGKEIDLKSLTYKNKNDLKTLSIHYA